MQTAPLLSIPARVGSATGSTQHLGQPPPQTPILQTSHDDDFRSHTHATVEIGDILVAHADTA
jgi:hypothetical protein